MSLQSAVQFFVNIGLLDVILPFILVFVVSYAILDYTKTLGSKQANAMVAFVMGFFVIVASNILNIVNALVSYFVIALLVVLCFALVFALLGIETTHKNPLYVALLLGAFFLFGSYAFVRTGNISEDKYWFLIILFLLLGGIGAVAYYVLRPTKKENKPEPPTPPPGPGPTPPPNPYTP